MARAEDLGTGISNVFRYLKPYAGTMPVFREEDLFIVEVPIGSQMIGGVNEVNGGVNEVDGGVNRLLETIKSKPGKRTSELAQIIDFTFNTVEKWIRRLKKENKIIYKGSTKSGGYYTLEHLKIADGIQLHGGANGGVNEVTGGANRLLEIIKNRPGKRTSELAEILGAPFSTVEKWIRKLKKENKIVFKGSTKIGGYYDHLES